MHLAAPRHQVLDHRQRGHRVAGGAAPSHHHAAQGPRLGTCFHNPNTCFTNGTVMPRFCVSEAWSRRLSVSSKAF